MAQERFLAKIGRGQSLRPRFGLVRPPNRRKKRQTVQDEASFWEWVCHGAKQVATV